MRPVQLSNLPFGPATYPSSGIDIFKVSLLISPPSTLCRATSGYSPTNGHKCRSYGLWYAGRAHRHRLSASCQRKEAKEAGRIGKMRAVGGEMCYERVIFGGEGQNHPKG